MKTPLFRGLLGSLLLAAASGCSLEAASSDAPDAPADTLPDVDVGVSHTAGYVLPACSDPSGFCITTIPVPSYLPARGGFDADSRGLFYISYRPDFVSGTVTYPDYYTALQVDWNGHVVSQSKPLPGRPSVVNPVVVGNRFVFGEGTRNAVMDVTGASSSYLTGAEPFPGYAYAHPNGGVKTGDGRYVSTTTYGGTALGIGGSYGPQTVIECGPDDPYMCQRPATDRTPGANGFLVTVPYGVARVRVGTTGGLAVTYAYCGVPASSPRINPGAPLASAPDVGAGELHAAFRVLDTGTLYDCRSTANANVFSLKPVTLPAIPRDYAYDSEGTLWIAMVGRTDLALRSASGSMRYVKLTSAQPGSPTYDEYVPVHVKLMPDDSAVVLTAGGHFLRIRSR